MLPERPALCIRSWTTQRFGRRESRISMTGTWRWRDTLPHAGPQRAEPATVERSAASRRAYPGESLAAPGVMPVIVFAIFTGAGAFQPSAILLVPIHGAANALLERYLRLPSQG